MTNNIYPEHVSPEEPDQSCMDKEVYVAYYKEKHEYRNRLCEWEENCKMICSLLFDHSDPIIKAVLKPSSKKWQKSIGATDFLLIRDIINKIYDDKEINLKEQEST